MATRWEALRRDARQLENELESKLVSFSKLGTAHRGDGRGGSSPSGPGSCDGMGMEINQLLQRLSKVNEAMNDVVGVDTSSAIQHTLQRHHDILQDYRQEFGKVKANIHAYQEREDLIGSVRQDIQAHKTAAGSVNRRTELYMKEHDHLRNSEKLADEALSSALAAKEGLSSQKRVLMSVSSAVSGLTNRFPAINNLVQKINFRKRRDSIVLGVVIAACVIALFLFAWS